MQRGLFKELHHYLLSFCKAAWPYKVAACQDLNDRAVFHTPYACGAAGGTGPDRLSRSRRRWTHCQIARHRGEVAAQPVEVVGSGSKCWFRIHTALDNSWWLCDFHCDVGDCSQCWCKTSSNPTLLDLFCRIHHLFTRRCCALVVWYGCVISYQVGSYQQPFGIHPCSWKMVVIRIDAFPVFYGQLQGSRPVRAVNDKFAATMTNRVRWRDASEAADSAKNDQLADSAQTSASDETDGSPSGAGSQQLRQITSDTEIQVPCLALSCEICVVVARNKRFTP